MQGKLTPEIIAELKRLDPTCSCEGRLSIPIDKDSPIYVVHCRRCEQIRKHLPALIKAAEENEHLHDRITDLETGMVKHFYEEHLRGDGPEIDRWKRENAALCSELENQWEYNHSEHCANNWPHEGDCHWPRPAILDSLCEQMTPEVKALRERVERLKGLIFMQSHLNDRNNCKWRGPQQMGDFPYADCTVENCIWTEIRQRMQGR